jgi:hypothetical protein
MDGRSPLRSVVEGWTSIKRPLTGVAAGQGPFLLLAEGKGFEPPRTGWVPP